MLQIAPKKLFVVFLSSLIVAYHPVSSSLIRTPRSIEATPRTTLIPHILWVNVHRVVNRNNEQDNLFDHYIVKTINKYRDSWNDQDVDVRTLSSPKCEDAISKLPFEDVSTDLLQYYRDNDPTRNICILANLFLYGGYFVKRTVNVIDAYIPSDNTSLTVVADPATGIFQEWFLASIPKHPLLNNALQKYILFAQGKLKFESNDVFKEIMRLSFDEFSKEPNGIKSMVFLSTKHLNNWQHDNDYKQIEKQAGEGPVCDQVIVDHDKKKAYFFTMFPGSHNFCRRITDNPEVVPTIEENGPKVISEVVTESSGFVPMIEMGESAIPRKMWVNAHQINERDSGKEKIFHQNIMSTIQKYKKAWDNDANVQVELLTNETCRNAISMLAIKGASSDLLNFHLTKDPQRKICHIAVLFLHGGYLVHRTVEVIEPYIAPHNIVFASVADRDISNFHGSFLAAAPYNPILYRALKKYTMLAQGKFEVDPSLAFTEIMRSSYNEVTAVSPDTKKNLSLLRLHKLNMLHEQNEYKHIKSQDGEGPYCNNVIIDDVQKKAHFYAMFAGADEHLCAAPINKLDPIIPLSNLQKLWFVTREDSSNLQNRFKQNIMNTVQAYIGGWNVANVEYNIVDVDACKTAIVKLPIFEASSTLLQFYMKEVKNDPVQGFGICCAAALYLNGGYCFNEEVELMEPFLPQNGNITFVGVQSQQSGLFLPFFVASIAEHPVIQHVLWKYMQLAQGKLKLKSTNPAGEIYRDSYFDQEKEEMTKSVLLLEKNGIITARL